MIQLLELARAVKVVEPHSLQMENQSEHTFGGNWNQAGTNNDIYFIYANELRRWEIKVEELLQEESEKATCPSNKSSDLGEDLQPPSAPDTPEDLSLIHI